MVIQTREKKRQAIEHLLTNVIQLDPDDILRKVLNTHSINTISQVLMMKSNSIDKLKYKDNNGKIHSTPAHVIAVFHTLKAWNHHLLLSHQVELVDWENNTYVNSDD